VRLRNRDDVEFDHCTLTKLIAKWHNSTANLMKTRRTFPKETVAAIRDGKILGIRAGTKPHRIIGIWAVVVEGRVFVRSYSLKPRSWWRTFCEEPRGIIEVSGKQIRVRPVFTRSERLKKLVDRAYAEKFPTPGSRIFVEGFKEKKRRDTTTELVPL
jgi:hypothetical protein